MSAFVAYNPFLSTITEARAGAILMKLELSMLCSGFNYLCAAVAETYEDPSVADYVTKSLVPKVAKRCNRDTSSVHRAMARAIDQMSRMQNPVTMKLYLGSENADINILSVVRGVANFMRLEDEGKVIQ